jgi:hypothetical protein
MTHLDPKALEAALNTYWREPGMPLSRYSHGDQKQMSAAVLAALAALPQAEPVAWIERAVLRGMGVPSVAELKASVYNCKLDDSYVPLFASPTPAVSREDVIKECAKLVDDVMKAEPPGRSKMMLAIAAKTVRRGRHLTDSEKHANLMRAMREAEAEDAALSQPHSEK